MQASRDCTDAQMLRIANQEMEVSQLMRERCCLCACNAFQIKFLIGKVHPLSKSRGSLGQLKSQCATKLCECYVKHQMSTHKTCLLACGSCTPLCSSLINMSSFNMLQVVSQTLDFCSNGMPHHACTLVLHPSNIG